jgi:hypothetical protein
MGLKSLLLESQLDADNAIPRPQGAAYLST